MAPVYPLSGIAAVRDALFIMATDTPHSAEYFGEQRDFWWNHDFLQLMARRWNLPPAPRWPA